MNIKNPDIVNFYNNYQLPKCKYGAYYRRIKIAKLPMEEAIQPEERRGLHLIKTDIDDLGRICTACGHYKEWIYFAKDKNTKTRHTSNCLYCRNQQKIKWREETQNKIDIEYRLKRRKLDIGTIICMEKEKEIYIDGIPREDKRKIVDYKFKKGYMLQSLLTGFYKRFDFGDNGKRPKFYIVNE